MRLLSRHAPVEEMVSPFSDKQKSGRMEVPLKAQKLLGEKPRVTYSIEELVTSHAGYADGDGGGPIPPKALKVLGEQGQVKPNKKSRDTKHRDPDSFWSIRDAEQISRSALSDLDSETMPGAKTGTALPRMPVSGKSSDNLLKSSSPSTEWTRTSRYPRQQPSIESFRREFYDASKHPSYVSQQTSESSMRDMRLHRGSPQISDASSGSPLLTRSIQQSPKQRPPMNDRTASDGPKRIRKVDLSLLLSHPKTSAGIIASGKFPRSPSREPSSLDFSPTETVHAQIARHGSKLRLETDRSTKPLPKQPIDSSNGRTKVFEPDIFDSRKRNVYRLPKGGKDWFDGIDISSDEEEAEYVELAPVELPANEVSRVQEALPSVFSLYGTPMREFIAPYTDDIDVASEEAVALPRSAEKTAMSQPRNGHMQISSATQDILGASAAPRKHGGESRLVGSRLGAQSVLSSASGSRRENVRIADAVGDIEIPRPQEAHISNSHHILTRNTASSRDREQTPPETTENGDIQSLPAQTRLIDISSASPKRSNVEDPLLSSASPKSHRKPDSAHGLRPATQESYARTGTRSSGEETSSSIPTDASRLMAVTEEEMMLLERMREKRAAMQKDSFTEGYRVARQEERHNQVRSPDRDSQNAAMYSPDRSRAGLRSRDTNTTETLLKEDAEMRRRMSAIRKEDVDRAFKMGRFLADETKDSTGPTRIEKFLVMAPEADVDKGGRPISGTEIETESRDDELDETDGEFASRLDAMEDNNEDEAGDDQSSVAEDDDDDAAEGLGLSWNEPTAANDDMKTPTQEQMPSPMQRLTDQVRDLPKYAARFFDDDVRKQAESSLHPRPAEKVQIPSPHSDDILERLIPRYDREGQELLSPKVYTPPVRSQTTPKPDSIQTDSEEEAPAVNSEVRVESPDTPVATTWARNTSLKHPLPQRQAPAMNFAPMESHRVPSAPPSVTTSLPSPLTPTLSSIPQSPVGTVSELAASSNRSPLRISRSASADVPNPLHSHPPESVKEDKPTSSRASPNLTTFKQKQTGRITSMTSITSAGEDVLAAWAELGGGRADALRFKRKKMPVKDAV